MYYPLLSTLTVVGFLIILWLVYAVGWAGRHHPDIANLVRNVYLLGILLMLALLVLK